MRKAPVKKESAMLWWVGIIFLLIWAIRATFFYNVVDAQIDSEFWQRAFSHFIKILIWIVPPVLYIHYRKKRNVLTELKITTPPHERQTTIILVLALVYFALYAYLTEDALIFATPLLTLLSISISPIIEETLFRGFILPELSERMHFWKANIVTSVVFVLVHWPYWIMTQGLTMGVLSTSLNIFVLSLFLGYALRKTNSLWPPVIIHILNNVVASLR